MLTSALFLFCHLGPLPVDSYYPSGWSQEKAQKTSRAKAAAETFREHRSIKRQGRSSRAQKFRDEIEAEVIKAPTIGAPATVELSIAVHNERRERLKQQILFRVKWFARDLTKPGNFQERWVRDLSPKADGTLTLPAISSEPGYVSITLPETYEQDWSILSPWTESIQVPPNLKGGKVVKVDYKSALTVQREVVDVNIEGLAPEDKLLLPDGSEVTGKSSYTIPRVDTEDANSSILVTSLRSGVEKITEVKGDKLASLDPYKSNLISIREDDWILSSIPGLIDPLRDPTQVQTLTDLPDLRRVAAQFGGILDSDKRLGELRKNGSVALCRLVNIPIELHVRRVIRPTADHKGEQSLPLIEEVRYIDYTAGDVAGIHVGESVANVQRRLGRSESRDNDRDLHYFSDGLIFEVTGDRVSAIRFTRPFEFIRQGFRPTPIRYTVAVEVHDDVETYDVLAETSGAPTVPLEFAQAFANKLKESGGLDVIPLNGTHPSFLVALSGINLYMQTTLEPRLCEMKGSVRIFDELAKRAIPETRLESASYKFQVPSAAGDARKQAFDDMLQKTTMFFLRHTVVGRVKGIDASTGIVTILFNDTQNLKQGFMYRIRNIDIEAMPADVVAFITEKPGGGLARCKLAKVTWKDRKRNTYSHQNFTEGAKYLGYMLNPRTGLVFADYLPTID